MFLHKGFRMLKHTFAHSVKLYRMVVRGVFVLART